MDVATVAAGGVDLVVREWGRENAHPLLFWPALNPWGSLLIEAAPLFVQRCFRVCSIAAPGIGESRILDDPDPYRQLHRRIVGRVDRRSDRGLRSRAGQRPRSA